MADNPLIGGRGDWIRDFGVVDSAGSLYFVSSGYRLSLYALSAGG